MGRSRDRLRGPVRLKPDTTSEPERLERAIEDRQILVTVHEQRAARVIDLVARGEIDMLQRLDDVEQTAGVHVDPEPAQQPESLL